MSNFDNFDIHQMSPKLAQRWHFACIFYCKKIFVLGSLDYAKNVKRYLFFGHPIHVGNLFVYLLLIHVFDTQYLHLSDYHVVCDPLAKK